MTDRAVSSEERAYIGIGSNLGDPIENCRRAIHRVSRSEGIRLLRVSSFYLTEPWGMKDQPWFINAVLQVQVSLSPRGLLGVLQGIERGMGRERIPSERWQPRIIDLDILLYGDRIVQEEGLRIPHPRLHQRRFVLEPLCEIDPLCRHPRLGRTMKDLLENLEGEKEAVEILRPSRGDPASTSKTGNCRRSPAKKGLSDHPA